MTQPMPPAEVEIDERLVGRLLREQFPRWSDLPLAVAGFGWDNVIYRLGDDLAVRLPRRRLGAELIEHEQRWLPLLAPRLPVAVPEPVGLGVPTEAYPWKWSVCRWVAGEMAATATGVDQDAVADELGEFVAALHAPAARGAPGNAYRGVALAARDEMTRAWIEQVGEPAAVAAWEQALAVRASDRPAVWVHGDLHPANILVSRGRLSGVIDFGDMCAGDPAVDLVSGWMLFDPGARQRFRRAAAVDDATWARGRGWALSIGLACIANSADNPVIAAVGRRAVDAVLSESGPSSESA